MCGLVGLVGADCGSFQEVETFRWLLNFDSTRGEDSTGIAFKRVRNGNSRSRVDILKAEGVPSNLFARNPLVFNQVGRMEIRTAERIDFLLGHNRSASVGGLGIANAHPFHHGHIVGAHNGTINQGLYMLPANAQDVKGSTDSEKIFHALSSDWSLKKIVNTITGAMALTWYNSRDNTYHLFRNKERDLFYQYEVNLGKLVYGSEDWIIRMAGRQSKSTWVSKDKIVKLEENEHLTFKLNVLSGRIESVSSEIVEKEAVVANTTQQFRGHGGQKERGVQGVVDEPRKSSVVPFTGKTNKVVGLMEGWYDHGPNFGRPLFAELVTNGCTMCAQTLTWEAQMSGEVKWANSFLPICNNCSLEFEIVG